MDKYIENQAVSDFYITDASVMNLNSTVEIFNGVSKELQDEIKALDGIPDFGSVYMQETQHKFNEMCIRDRSDELFDFLYGTV